MPPVARTSRLRIALGLAASATIAIQNSKSDQLADLDSRFRERRLRQRQLADEVGRALT
jgi:hypothetical protein